MKKKMSFKRIIAFVLVLTMGFVFPTSLVSANAEEATKELTALDVVRQISDESIILLKNDNNALPLKEQSNVALFGDAQVLKYQSVYCLIEQPGYIPYAAGSSYINPASNTMAGPLTVFREYQKAGLVNIYEPLAQSYENQSKFFGEYTNERKEEITTEYVPTDDEYELASQFADTAIVFIRRWGGECFDYTTAQWELTDAEKTMLKTVSSKFEKVVVVLNTGTPIDMDWAYGSIEGIEVDAVIYSGYGGYYGGYGIADTVMGRVNPSGKTTSTWAKDIYDYPSTETFLASNSVQEYTEDIFVGYRYFETIPGASEKVLYPFGFGLSYTDFDIALEDFKNDGETVTVSVKVTNTGAVAGKEVVQLYFGAPQKGVGEAVLDKAKKELCAFTKTELLEPGQSEVLTLTFKVDDMSSYDDFGYTGHKSAYVLEKGDYTVYFGNSVRNTSVAGTVTIDALEVVEQLSEQCPSELTERLTHDGTFINIPAAKAEEEETEEEDTTLPKIGSGAVTIEAEAYTEIAQAATKSPSGASLYDPSTEAWVSYPVKALGDTWKSGAYSIYKVDVTKAGYYSLSVRASSNGTTATGKVLFSVSADGSEYTLLTEANVSDTYTPANTFDSTAFKNQYHNYKDFQANDVIYLEEGVQFVKLTFSNNPGVDSFTLTPEEVKIYIDGNDVVDSLTANYGNRSGVVLNDDGTWTGVSGSYLMNLSSSGAYVIYKAEIPAEGDYKMSFRLATVKNSHNHFSISVSDALEGTYTEVPMSLNLPNTSQLYNGTSSYFFAFIDTEAITVHLNKGTNYIKLTGANFGSANVGSPNFAHILIEKENDSVRYLAKDYYELHEALKTNTKTAPKVYNSESWISSSKGVTYVDNKAYTSGRYATYKIEVSKAGKYDLSLRGGSPHDNAYIAVSASTDNVTYNTVVSDMKLENQFTAYQTATGDTATTYRFNVIADCALGEIELKEGTNYIRFIMPKAEAPSLESFLLTYKGEAGNELQDGTGVADYKLKDVYNNVITMEQFVDQMTNYELSSFSMLHLSKSAGTIKEIREKYGIENIVLDNTPSGIISGTCFPSQTAMASTQNLTLAEAFGKCIAKEAVERGFGIWEAPSINNQRNPLGGRYNEYYSEDPFVSGTFASVVTKAVQEKGVGVMIKHFVGNEKESGKLSGDTRVTERALREIYLEPFRIVTRYEMPWSFMSAYNKINGVQCCENYDLVHNILREEWGFDGFVSADWNGGTDVVKAVKAHNNMHPRTQGGQAANIIEDTNRVHQAILDGYITRDEIKRNVSDILNVAIKTENFYRLQIEPDGRKMLSTDEYYHLASMPASVTQQLALDLSNELKALNIESTRGAFAGLKMTVADTAGSFVKSQLLTNKINCIDYENKKATLSIHNTFKSADLYVMLGVYIPDGVWTRVIHEGSWTKIPAGESVTLTRDFSEIESVQGYSSAGVASRMYTQNEFATLMYFRAPDAEVGDVLYLTADELSTTAATSGGVEITEVWEETLCDYAKWNVLYKLDGKTENAYETLSAQGISAKSGDPFETNVLDSFIARATDNEEYTFVGWYTEDGTLISKDKNYTYVPVSGAKEQIVYACYTTYTNTLQGANLEIGSSLTLNYYADLDEEHSSAKIRITRNSVVTELSGVYDEAKGYYKFSYTGINPQCMVDNIKAELIYNGEVISSMEDYSVKTYADNLAKKTAAELNMSNEKYNALITLLSDMLVYGEESQKHQEYNQTEYATDGILWLVPSEFAVPTDGIRNIVSGNTDVNNRVEASGVFVSNVNKIYFRVTLTDDVTVLVDGKEVTPDQSNKVYTEDIVATGFSKPHTIELIKNGETISKVEYNVNAYVQSKHDTESVGSIVKALSNYGASAKAYSFIANVLEGVAPNTDNGSLLVTGRGSRTSGPRQEILEILKANGNGEYYISGWMRLNAPEESGVQMQMIAEYKDTSTHWPQSAFKTVYGTEWTKFGYTLNVTDVDNMSYCFISVHTVVPGSVDYDKRPYIGDIICDDFGLYKKNADGTWSDQLLINGDFRPNAVGGADGWTINGTATLTNTKSPAMDFTGVKGEDGSIMYSKGFVPTTDENVIFSGRWTYKGEGKMRASFEGYVELNFEGTELYVLNPAGQGYVEIDDSGEYTLYDFSGSTKIAENLSNTSHKVRIYTRAQISNLTVGGFYIGENAKTLKIADGPVIEFIGDSIMEGYTVDDTDRTINSNSYLNSYGFLVGKKLSENYGFRFHNVAFGGIGLANYADPLNIGGRYFKEREYQGGVDESTVPVWDTSKLVPDYIVINIGTNDYNKDQAEAKANYISFLDALYEAYPEVKIVIMTPFDSSATHNNDAIVQTIKEVVALYDDVLFLDSYEWGMKPGADGLHPSITTHKAVAERLYPELVNGLGLDIE